MVTKTVVPPDRAPGIHRATGGDLPAGTVVGEYRIEGVAGRGGMGVVYAALQPVIEKKAAIKVLNAQLSADRDLVRRFIDEARAVNRIGHENIIDIFSFGQLPDGRQYFVMEYLEGATLAERLERGDLPPTHLHPILAQVCDALEAAHAKKIVHRDLKPENVWIASTNRGYPKVRLLDFGIAKLLETGDRSITDVGAVMGTPHYMSPEQCNGRGVDHRTDIYALGVLMYRLFTGQLPIRGETYAEILAKQLTLTPPPPSTLATVPPALDRLIVRCLEKTPEARPQSAAELGQALLDIFGTEGLSGPQALWVPHSLPLARTLPQGSAGTSVGPEVKTGASTAERPLESLAPAGTRRPSRVALVLGAALMTVLLGIGAWFMARSRGGAPGAPPSMAASAPASAGPIGSPPGAATPVAAPAHLAPVAGSTTPASTARASARPAVGAMAPVEAGAPARAGAPSPRGGASATRVTAGPRDPAARPEESPPAPGRRSHERASSTGLVTDNPFE